MKSDLPSVALQETAANSKTRKIDFISRSAQMVNTISI